MRLTDLRAAADVTSPNSLSNRFRNRRFEVFAGLVKTLRHPIRILDVGGTVDYWRQRRWHERSDVRITVVNLNAEPSDFDNISLRRGDALDLSEYSDAFFDVVYSNSVIEHLFSLENQMAMAREIRRVARCYWIQTPNFWFPIEPHFHFVGWHWLPRAYRVDRLMKRRCGMRGPVAPREEAEKLVDEIRLLSATELKSMFPGGTLWRERFFGLTKSLVVFGGFSRGQGRG